MEIKLTSIILRVELNLKSFYEMYSICLSIEGRNILINTMANGCI